MKLYHLKSTNTYINLHNISSITPASNGEGFYVAIVHAPTEVINSAELADILKHVSIVNPPKRPMPQFNVGDRVRYQFSDDDSRSTETAVVTGNNPMGIVAFVYPDGTEFMKYADSLILVESVTHGAPEQQADWSKLPRFKVGDKVLYKGKKLGTIIAIEGEMWPYEVEFAPDDSSWCKESDITHE